MSRWRLLLTRPEQECQALAQALAGEGIQSACLPLLGIEQLPETPQHSATICDLHRYTAVIVVSKPAARFGLELMDRYWPQPLSDQPWFSVGAGTGQILADYGLTVFWPSSGDDSEALLELPELQAPLKAALFPRVLIIRGEDGRTLLAERLQAQGVEVDYLPVYRRVLPTYPTGALQELIQVERLNGLVVSSGQGLMHLRQLAADNWPTLAQLPLFVPSPRVAEMARELGAVDVVDCRGADTAALLAALRAQASPDS
ncbi:uroporphyrinogen-III synthase [Phytopseudomonas punonensis]|uniref:Uroporphyrinogen-III synthase n=1 Tax=Phytopseudomonas punonensis TaxID=1220495 RepID=A0A1M6ZBU7_9GAMM|nr:uroporphyrinogen-III synthase [Pseudomonas punonensis]SHL27948.1 uroporphyrinogen-III synthase [Pseudomonas punonensis]